MWIAIVLGVYVLAVVLQIYWQVRNVRSLNALKAELDEIGSEALHRR